MKSISRSIAAPSLALIILLSQVACTFNPAKDIQLAIAAYGPFVESLNLGGNKQAVIADFAELTSDAATMVSEFNACAGNKVCDLNAISKFEAQFEVVDARGHFGIHPSLAKVEGILKGLIASAKLYYSGAKSSAGPGKAATRTITEKDLKAQIDQLKAAMTPTTAPL